MRGSLKIKRPKESDLYVAHYTVKNYIEGLESIIESLSEDKGIISKSKHKSAEEWRKKSMQYRDEAIRLRYKLKERAIPRVPLKAAVAVDVPLRTSQMHLAMMDHLMVYGVSKSRYTDIYRLVKYIQLFVKKDKKWDPILTLICLHASSVEYFNLKTLYIMLNENIEESVLKSSLFRLVKYGYIKRGTKSKDSGSLFFITEKGLDAVKEFTKELRSIKINIDCYAEVFKEAFRESKRPDGKASKAIRRSIHSVGEQVQRKLTRAKPSGRKSGIPLDRRPDRFEEG